MVKESDPIISGNTIDRRYVAIVGTQAAVIVEEQTIRERAVLRETTVHRRTCEGAAVECSPTVIPAKHIRASTILISTYPAAILERAIGEIAGSAV